MKKYKLLPLIALGFLSSCTDLNVGIESELTPGNFPSSTESFIAATGPIYTSIRGSYAVNYWRLQELSTDEAFLPARDGNYDDGGQYRFLHLHTWGPDHPTVKAIWEWGFGGINTCNRILKLFETVQDSDNKRATIAEVQTMRALYYFFMMDLYGNIPIIKEFGSSEQPSTAQRADVFQFIESELLAALPNLTTTTGQLTYGRANKWLAYSILQKLYLNAEYYIGQNKYAESVAMADEIINAGNFSLDNDYLSIFKPDNGPQISETIFAIPYDANVAEGNHFNRFGLHTAIQQKYEIPFRPSIALSTIKEFYEKFNLPGDIRNQTWLAGKQYDFAGNPITIATTKKGLDASYNGADATAPIVYHLDFTPETPLRNVATMDVGNDELGKARGVRNIKFYPDKNAHPSTRFQNNDVPVFRLADIYLMKAEAILRGAPATTVKGELQTPAVLVNKIRTRAKTTPVTSITLDELLEERARELAWEGWRRNDLIRFGKFEDAWGFKTNTDVTKRIYPVPRSEMTLNPKLTQNPGY